MVNNRYFCRLLCKVKKELPKNIIANRIPSHVAIIMDGNGRWARQQGKERIFGHFQGVESVRESVEASIEIGVKYLTLYAFSTENWNRPQEEVNALMELLVNTILAEVPSLNERGIRIRFIGDRHLLPQKCIQTIEEAEQLTLQNKELQLILALSYSGRWEITKAVRRITEADIAATEITEDLISQYLETSDIPDPELLIRTSGEQRISNFLLWQIAYAELFFTDQLWPDFNKEMFFEAIRNYQGRERRFGKTSEQIQ